jgi:hypothetical protein
MKYLWIIVLLVVFSHCSPEKKREEAFYVSNRAPLRPNPYLELPLGSIQPEGWLKEMLLRQKEGATGHLDEWYPRVMGSRNGWLGGDGDQWERGPYWIDGLLPLAYILKDDSLIAKTKPWIEWALQSQQPDGYFGPVADYPPEKGLQRNNSRDWWPKMVMLKILRQYYSATGDERVISLLTGYFRYQLENLPKTPLGHWTFWGEFRACDNLMVVYWLYNITGDSFLLDLADLISEQAFDFTDAFLNQDHLSRPGSLHCVNLAQGIKEPLIIFQHHPEPRYEEATLKAFRDLRRNFGHPTGLYGGDETLHSANPTQGSELCTAVEMMYSLETILAITGNVQYADHLERVAFNALPTQISDSFTSRQYFQQANQVMVTRHIRNFDVNHDGTDVCFGLLTGYPCCTSNMHQGWPKFTQNLFYATPGNGVAALLYAPSSVTLRAGSGDTLTIREETGYPFSDSIQFTFSLQKSDGTLHFPFHLRIPLWCHNPSLTINGQQQEIVSTGHIIRIERDWESGDKVVLTVPMEITFSEWYENSRAVERGPLVYALRIGESINSVMNTKDPEIYGETYEEVKPTSPWNYGLPEKNLKEPAGNFEIITHAVSDFPWNLENAPVEIKTSAIRIPHWNLYNEMAGPQPWGRMYKPEVGASPQKEEITLIPYGCTTLRISEFPVLRDL